jgi:hypothetical protein
MNGSRRRETSKEKAKSRACPTCATRNVGVNVRGTRPVPGAPAGTRGTAQKTVVSSLETGAGYGAPFSQNTVRWHLGRIVRASCSLISDSWYWSFTKLAVMNTC